MAPTSATVSPVCGWSSTNAVARKAQTETTKTGLQKCILSVWMTGGGGWRGVKPYTKVDHAKQRHRIKSACFVTCGFTGLKGTGVGAYIPHG